MDEKALEIKDLLLLLDDPDELIWQTIRDRIMQTGSLALPILQEHWQSVNNPDTASRIQELINAIQFKELTRTWEKWWNSKSGTLMEGVVLLGKIIDPEINITVLEHLIKPIKDEIWIELSDKLTAIEKIRIINYLLFEKRGFKTIDSIDSKSRHLLLTNLLYTGSGHPLSVALLYVLLCRELSIPVYKAGNGENSTLVRLDVQDNTASLIYKLGNYSALFYILPDNNGEMIGKGAYADYLQNQFPTQKPAFEATTDKMFIRIILQKMHNLSEAENKQQHLLNIKQLLSVCVIR